MGKINDGRITRIVFVLVIVFIVTLIIGAGKQFYLSQYEEECYMYKIYYWNETYCSNTMTGIDYKNTNEEHPCCSESVFPSSWSNGTEFEHRWCFGIPFNKTQWEFTDECDKYHLVRKVGD